MMKQINSSSKRNKKQLKDKYFYGIGSLIAKRLGISAGYVRNILNDKFPNRKTRSTRKIKELANELMKDKK
jgi:transcriptional regulator with XRE-family HTH domain